MKKIIIYCLPMLLLVSACKKDNKTMILGSWVETIPVTTTTCCDTYSFRSNGKMDILLNNNGQTYTYPYKVQSNDEIKIDDFADNRTLKYEFNSSFSTLTISKYYVSMVGEEDKDLVLTKIN